MRNMTSPSIYCILLLFLQIQPIRAKSMDLYDFENTAQAEGTPRDVFYV